MTVDPTAREITVYVALILVLVLTVHTLSYHDDVRVAKPLRTTHVLRPGIDRIPAPRCPEVYRLRPLSGWIVTEADGKTVNAGCDYSTPKKVWL